MRCTACTRTRMKTKMTTHQNGRRAAFFPAPERRAHPVKYAGACEFGRGRHACSDHNSVVLRKARKWGSLFPTHSQRTTDTTWFVRRGMRTRRSAEARMPGHPQPRLESRLRTSHACMAVHPNSRPPGALSPCRILGQSSRPVCFARTTATTETLAPPPSCPCGPADGPPREVVFAWPASFPASSSGSKGRTEEPCPKT